MNQFDERYEIRLARRDEIETVMRFIGEVWRKGHILSFDREYFEYEFCDGEQVNIIIAIDRKTGSIEAISGFLYSSADPDRRDIWGSFWKVNDLHDNDRMLGVELERRVKDLAGCRYNNGIGDNPHTAVPLYRMFLRFRADRMRHWYMLNPSADQYRVAVVRHREIRTPDTAAERELYEISDFDEIDKNFVFDREQIPYKDGWYVRKKFFLNPRRNYRVYGIRGRESEGRLPAFLVTRECGANGVRILRIVDYYGDREAFAGIGGRLLELMSEEQYEYIDFYNYGFEDEFLSRAGFVRRKEKDRNVIPNYFEPFVQENVDIWIHYEKEGALFYKADGDQDRANAAEV